MATEVLEKTPFESFIHSYNTFFTFNDRLEKDSINDLLFTAPCLISKYAENILNLVGYIPCKHIIKHMPLKYLPVGQLKYLPIISSITSNARTYWALGQLTYALALFVLTLFRYVVNYFRGFDEIVGDENKVFRNNVRSSLTFAIHGTANLIRAGIENIPVAGNLACLIYDFKMKARLEYIDRTADLEQ